MLLSVNGSTTKVCSACLRGLAQPLPPPPVEHAPPCERCRNILRSACICPGPLTPDQARDEVLRAARAAARRMYPGSKADVLEIHARVLLARARDVKPEEP